MTTEEAKERIKTRFNKWALDNEDLTALQVLGLVDAESEDERLIEMIIDCLNRADGAWGSCIGDRIENWLKSLRSQPHWKPSEEQVDALNEAVGDYRSEDTASCEKTADILESLYSDLQKQL